MALTTATLELAAELSPWTVVLQRCAARCRSQCCPETGETVAQVHVDLHRLLDGHGDASWLRLLREAMELMRLALAIDARVLEALEEMNALVRHFPWPHDDDVTGPTGRLAPPSDVAFVAHYERISTDALYQSVAAHWSPCVVIDGSPNFELKRARLRAKLPEGPAVVETRPLRVSFDLLLSTLEILQPVRLVKAQCEFFRGLTAVDSHIHVLQSVAPSTDAVTLPTGKTLVDLVATRFRVKLGFIQPTQPLMPAVRGLTTVPEGLIQCRLLALGVRDLKCTPDDLAEYLALVLPGSPDAVVRVVHNSALRPLSRSRRNGDWSKETETLFHALEACKSLIHFVATDITDPAGTSEEDRVRFWTAFLQTLLTKSPTGTAPLKQIRLNASRRVASDGEADAIRQALLVYRGERRTLESLVVDISSATSLDDLLEFSRFVGPVQSLTLDAFDFTLDFETMVEPVLDLHPVLEKLAVGNLRVDSLDCFLQRYGTSGRLESLVLRDVELVDRRSVVRFFDGLRDPSLPLAQRLHTLRFHQRSTQRALALDEPMVAALETLLCSNRWLRDVCVVVRHDLPLSAREALLAHAQDLVIPPAENRRRDVARRVAFWSIVESKGNRAINQLDPLVVRLIFGFSSTHWTRSVRIVENARVW